MIISEQRGRLFTGNLSTNSSLNHTDLGLGTEGFSGIIGLDNRTIYMAEYDKGYDIGTITSNDTIELAYLEDGEKAGAFIDRFHRVN